MVKQLVSSIFLALVSFSSQAATYAVKADDFGRGDMAAWENFFRELEPMGVKIYLGVVLTDLRNNPKALDMFNYLKRNPNIRFFYHGHTHDCGVDETGRKFGEFIAPLSEQEALLADGKAWLAESGETSYIFNAPCGASDKRTAAALANTGYDVWFYPKKDRDDFFSGCKVRYTAKVENPTFTPNFETFGQQFKYIENKGGEHLLQVHAGAWGGAKLAEFVKIIRSMQYHGASFGWVCEGE